VVRPALDDVHDSLDLARRKLNHDLADPPVPGNKAESCRDRFGHAMLCGPISPDAIESDSVRIGGGALCRAQGCLGTEPRKSARGSVREEPALRRPLCVVDLAPFIGAFFSRFPQEHNKVLQFRRHFLRRLKALPKLMPNDGLQGVI
jgi:hypothetical protein